MKDIPQTDFDAMLRLLVAAQIEFIVVGGMAATIHGSARLTHDLDIVYRRTPENISRIVAALGPHSPYLRGAPPGLPFRLDERAILAGLNFTLITDIGAIDLLGEIAGGGNYDQLLAYATKVQVLGVDCLCLNLDKLVLVKRAAGRPKDLEIIAELEALLEERQEHKPSGN